MKIPLPVLLAPVFVTSSCERAGEEPVLPTNTVQAASPAPTEGNAAATSIMRPEVAEEVAVPAPPPVAEPLRGIINFGDSGAELDDSAKAALDRLLTEPRFANGGEIILSGHSDAKGSDADNLAVSRRRAEAVRDYLLSKSVPAERIKVIALGELRPLEPNAQPDGSDFPEGRRRNRRVEITVAPPPSVAPSAAVAPSESKAPAEPPSAATEKPKPSE